MKTRERIVEAAERVVRERGLARTTTKEIARAAGYSEGTLYKHFESKEDLFLAVLAERLPSFVVLVEELPARVGRGTVQETLEEVATNALAYYGEIVPMAASIFSEPGLLARHREGLRKRGAGPQMINETLASYLDAEERLGRVRKDADFEAAAAMLLGLGAALALATSLVAMAAPTAAQTGLTRDTVRRANDRMSQWLRDAGWYTRRAGIRAE